jgi:hypothetical protein
MEELDGDRIDTLVCHLPLTSPEPSTSIDSSVRPSAQKRVAAISTALNFILTKLPSLFALSPPLLVAIGLLQGLAPIVGYVASFIAWSWAHVKSFDRGQGVVLSATWAMPVALIPRVRSRSKSTGRQRNADAQDSSHATRPGTPLAHLTRTICRRSPPPSTRCT